MGTRWGRRRATSLAPLRRAVRAGYYDLAHRVYEKTVGLDRVEGGATASGARSLTGTRQGRPKLIEKVHFWQRGTLRGAVRDSHGDWSHTVYR